MGAHHHQFVKGPPLQVTVIPSRCACGQMQLGFLNPLTGEPLREIALPVELLRTAAAGRHVFTGAREVIQTATNVLEALRRLGVVK